MHLVENPPIPFTQNFNGGGMPENSSIVIHGTAHQDTSKTFAIDLCINDLDIAMHVNARFKFLEHTIVINSKMYGIWQKEERHKNPLTIGNPFKLRITSLAKHMKIELNDYHRCTFDHRVPADRITHLQISGDIRVKGVEFTGINVDPPMNPTPEPNSSVPMEQQQYPQPQPPFYQNPDYNASASSLGQSTTYAPQFPSPQPQQYYPQYPGAQAPLPMYNNPAASYPEPQQPGVPQPYAPQTSSPYPQPYGGNSFYPKIPPPNDY